MEEIARLKRKEYKRVWHFKHRDQISMRKHELYMINPEARAKATERAKGWYRLNSEKVLKAHKETQDLRTSLAKELRIKWKAVLFSILGDKCVHCGFTDERALQVDHINGGGGRIRREQNKRSTYSYYRMLALDKETSKHFQLLCSNCNWIKRCENNEINQHSSIFF